MAHDDPPDAWVTEVKAEEIVCGAVLDVVVSETFALVDRSEPSEGTVGSRKEEEGTWLSPGSGSGGKGIIGSAMRW